MTAESMIEDEDAAAERLRRSQAADSSARRSIPGADIPSGYYLDTGDSGAILRARARLSDIDLHDVFSDHKIEAVATALSEGSDTDWNDPNSIERQMNVYAREIKKNP